MIRGRGHYNDGDEFPFGKHKGTKFANVPADYLLYLFDMPWIREWPGVEMYIDQNIDHLLEEQKRERSKNSSFS